MDITSRVIPESIPIKFDVFPSGTVLDYCNGFLARLTTRTDQPQLKNLEIAGKARTPFTLVLPHTLIVRNS